MNEKRKNKQTNTEKTKRMYETKWKQVYCVPRNCGQARPNARRH